MDDFSNTCTSQDAMPSVVPFLALSTQTNPVFTVKAKIWLL